jgi:protein O-mannosyl-transferase
MKKGENILSRLKPHRDLYVTIFIAVTIFLVYLNSITGEFVFDDWPLIKDDPLIHSLANWKAIFIHGYRPVRTFLLAVLYHFFKLNPIGYHIVNIIIHILTSTAVYFLCLRLTHQKKTSIFTAFIFATHPIQTDAVAYIAGMRDTLSSLFYVMGMYYFIKYRQTNHVRLLVVFVLFYILGSFTKETGAIMLFSFILYDYVTAYRLHDNPGIKNVLKNIWKTALEIIMVNKTLYISLFLFFSYVVYYYLFMKHSTPRVRVEGVEWYGGSMLLNYMAIPKIIIYYIKQLIWPVHLLVDYKFFPIVPRNPYEIQAILSLTTVIVAILLALYMLNHHKIMAFGFLWFILTLSPALNILPHHEFMAEHYLYLPLVGFSLVLGSMFATVSDRLDTKKKSIAVILSFSLLIIGYSVRTILRNQDWQNDLTISEAQLKIRPDSARTLMELGYLYIYMNLPESAEKKLKESLRIKPGYGPSLTNLGQVSLKRAEYEKAIEYYRQAFESRVHQAAKARQNMALVLMSLRKKDEGMAIFEKILERDPNHRAALVSMAYAHFFDGKYEKAAEYLQRNLRNRPVDVEAYFLLSEVYRKLFLFEKASLLYDIILNIEPGNKKAIELKKTVHGNQKFIEQIKTMKTEDHLPPDGYLLLADLFIQVQEYERAATKLEEALESYPNHLELWKKYESAQFVQRKFDKALKAAQNAVTIDPQDAQGHFLLARNYLVQLDFDRAAMEVSFINDAKINVDGLNNLKKLAMLNAPKAEKALQLLTKDKNNPEGRLLLGEVYISLGLTDKAMEQYRDILDDFPAHQEARYHLARMHVRENSTLDMREAMHLLGSVLNEDPHHTDAHNLMGAIYLVRLDNFELAYQHFEQSLRSDPEQKDAERIQKTAAALKGYIHAVTVEKKYLLPFVVEEKQFEKWLMPAVATTPSF